MRRALPPEGRRVRVVRGARLLAALLSLAWWGGAAAEESGEYAVKAAFLYNFARYTEWPPGSFRDKFVIGVVGADPFGAHLEAIAKRKTLRGARIVLQRFAQVEDVKPDACQMVFLSSDRPADLRRLRQKLGRRHVLLVTDGEGLAKQGAAVNFLLVNNKVRFEVNPKAVSAAGLKMSAKLMRLAKIVS